MTNLSNEQKRLYARHANLWADRVRMLDAIAQLAAEYTRLAQDRETNRFTERSLNEA